MADGIARYKDLCIDAVDAPPQAAFWAAALGIGPVEDHGGPLLLRAPDPRGVVWVNQVPEPHTVKNRLHLDVHCASVEELETLGARVLERFPRWTVMADPDGGEFCAFPREEVPAQRLYELVLDCFDPQAQAAWWAGVLGGEVDIDEADQSYGVQKVPGAPFEWLVLGTSQDPKIGKNRVHVDVLVDDVQRLVAHGATVLRTPDDDVQWTVMADPEGNEFCAFVDPSIS